MYPRVCACRLAKVMVGSTGGFMVGKSRHVHGGVMRERIKKIVD